VTFLEARSIDLAARGLRCDAAPRTTLGAWKTPCGKASRCKAF